MDADDVRVGDLAGELQLALEWLLELPDILRLHRRVEANELQLTGATVSPAFASRVWSASASVPAIVAPSANPWGYGV